jgi:hypothetical protein
MNLKSCLLLCALTLRSAVQAMASDGNEALSESNRVQAARLQQELCSRCVGHDDLVLRPGLVADRGRRFVHLLVETTDLGPRAPCEFVMIATNSGHAYEALSVAYARPSDVHDALKFIGLQPGAPYDGDLPRLWPKGERVRLSLVPAASYGTFSTTGVPVSTLLTDNNSGGSMSPDFVFSGARMAPASEGGKDLLYGANQNGPCSIASTYNEGYTVLDVPRRALQGDVYNSICIATNFAAWSNRLAVVQIEPSRKDGRPGARSFDLAVSIAEGTNGVAPAFSLSESPGVAVVTGGDIRAVHRAVTNLVAQGFDPFVTIRFDGKMPLERVREVCAVLATMESDRGLRVDSPPDGEPYYKAFLPKEEFRDRSARPAQPWELRVRMTNGTTSAVLTRIEEKWKDDGSSELKASDHPASSPAEVLKLLKTLEESFPAMLIFADGTLRYADLVEYVRPIRPVIPAIHIFCEKPDGAAH